MTFSGDGTITGLVAGGLPDATIQQADLASNVSGTGPAFGAYLANTQTISSATWTKVNFDTELFDTNNNFASSRFTPTVAGYYQINALVQFLGTTNPSIAVYKNGSSYQQGVYTGVNGGNPCLPINTIVYCNGSTDYIEIWGFNSGGTQFNGAGVVTWVTGCLVRGA